MLRKFLISVSILMVSAGFTQVASATGCGEVVTTACSSGVVWAAQYSDSQCSACGGYNSFNVGGGCYKFVCKTGGTPPPTPTPTPNPVVATGCSSGVVGAASNAASICSAQGKGTYSIHTGNGCYSFYCNL